MSRSDPDLSSPATGEGGPGDLSRRIRARREAQGWSVAELAERAGMAPGYLHYLEHHAAAAPGPGALARLAAALDTTVASLRGAGHEHPPGAGPALGGRPVLEVLDEADCRRLVSPGGVGRVVYPGPRAPVAVPVNFVVDDDEVVIRTGDGALAGAARREGHLSFEVDHLDEELGEGWSVLVVGPARVEELGDTSEAPSGALPEPWAGGARTSIVRVRLDELTGRRIRRLL